MSVAEVFRRVQSSFVWQSDRDSFGMGTHWDEFSDAVCRGAVVRRDCEDFTLTGLALGINEYGWDKSKCRTARVLTEVGDRSCARDH